MSKFEIKQLFGLTIVQHIWWKFVPGTTITIPWPKKEWLTLHDDGDGSTVQAHTNDPNYHYRPYLEKNVGKQGRDWDWWLDPVDGNTLTIKFRKGKESWASIITIIWT